MPNIVIHVYTKSHQDQARVIEHSVLHELCTKLPTDDLYNAILKHSYSTQGVEDAEVFFDYAQAEECRQEILEYLDS